MGSRVEAGVEMECGPAAYDYRKGGCEGLYKPKPGWKFTKGEKGTVIARQNTGPGIVITPCECALEPGGSCAQATIDGPDGDIKELWCVDQGCGFCVGGTVEPDDPLSAVRFNVVCKASRASP